MNESRIVIGVWTADRDTNSIRRGDEVRHLQPLSINILFYLAEHVDRVVTSEELIARFWPRRVVADDAVHRRIADLRKTLEDDSRHPSYIRTVPKRGYQLVATVAHPAPAAVAERTPRRFSRPVILAAIVGALILATVLAAIQVQRVFEKRSDVAAAIVNAEAMLAEDNYQKAYLEVAPFRHESDLRLAALFEKILLPVSIYTEPAGVPVAYRFPAPGADWQSLGVTPISDISLPRGHYKLRIGDVVLMDATNPGVSLNSANQQQRVITLPVEPVPEDMAFIPGGKYRLGAWGFVDEFDLGGFFIDRLEVSNRDYQEFVDAGGYRNPDYWQSLIDSADGKLTWEIIQSGFVDITGQPGPSTWEQGRYPTGQQMLPVTGVSWYEANAYLAFRKKTLPAVHHWLRAALGPMEWKYPFASELVPQSNVGTATLLPVDRQPGAEVNGTFDMIGNAAEWTALDSHGSKAVIGSSFLDPVWAYNFPQPLDPLQRPGNIGIRGMRASTGSATGALPAFPLFNDFSGSIRKVSDDEFAGIRHAFDYTAGTLDLSKVVQVGETAFENWTRREILIPTGHQDDPLPVFLFIPRHFEAPYQSVIFLPPADSWSPGFRSDSILIENYQIDFVPRSGRVLIWPVYSGSHERYDDYHADAGPERARLALERNRRVRDEVGRVIDYLEGSSEFDASKVATMAMSYGATLAPFILATEPRISTAINYAAGIAPPIPIFVNPQNDPNVFWARVRQPVLLINGRYDPIRPHEFVVRPLLDLLATPTDARKLILYESGHWPLPRYLMMRDSLQWLDQYLGRPVPRNRQ